MARGARLSGSRFAYRIGDVAVTEMALYQFVLAKLRGKGFLTVLPPILVGERAMYGTGSCRRKSPICTGWSRDDLYLTGTSEVALAGIHTDERLEEDELPAKYAGFTTNFRREAGAAGKDTRGMFRVHQFDKVEMYVFCVPEQSRQIHEELLAHEEEIAQELGLPYRVMNISVGDLGAAGGQEVRHRGVVPDSAAVPGDHVLLEHDRLSGQAAEHQVPPRRQARVRAHPERHGRDRAGAAVDHGELPGRGRQGRRSRGAQAVRRPGLDRPALRAGPSASQRRPELAGLAVAISGPMAGHRPSATTGAH